MKVQFMLSADANDDRGYPQAAIRTIWENSRGRVWKSPRDERAQMISANQSYKWGERTWQRLRFVRCTTGQSSETWCALISERSQLGQKVTRNLYKKRVCEGAEYGNYSLDARNISFLVLYEFSAKVDWEKNETETKFTVSRLFFSVPVIDSCVAT